MKQWADLPTPRAKEKAKERFAQLEARIEELRRQQQDAGEVVEQYHQQMCDLQLAIADARAAMKSENEAEALRRRAEALKGLLVAMRCEFVATGRKGRGTGQARQQVSSGRIRPDCRRFGQD